jgi:flagellar motor switch protein FliN/FliY
MTHSPYFLKSLEASLKETLEIPMWGKAPEFPWDAFTEQLRSVFEIPSVEIECMEADWKSAEQITLGFSQNPLHFSMNMSPLAAPFFLMVASEDVELLSKLLLDKEGKRSFSDTVFQKGFSQFILLHLLKSFHDISPYQGLKARLSSQPLIQEISYCVDLSITFPQGNILARCIFPQSFHRILTSHFSSKPLPLHRLNSSIEIPLSIQLGKVTLSKSELDTVSLGDFIILDECSFHPKTEQGTFFLSLGSLRLFILKRKHHEIKILDYALHEFNTFDDEEDLGMDIEDNDFSEDLEFEEPQTPSSQEKQHIEPLISKELIPLSLLVEVGKLSLPLKDLLALKPGNTLPLGHALDQGVVLTLNTKPVARGHLVQLGDMIGVKISEIAH